FNINRFLAINSESYIYLVHRKLFSPDKDFPLPFITRAENTTASHAVSSPCIRKARTAQMRRIPVPFHPAGKRPAKGVPCSFTGETPCRFSIKNRR
ncbi:hypothetical protein J9B28_28165, partial [Klebsiella pneumoniae]